MSANVYYLTPDDVSLLDAILETFGEVLDEMDTYTGNRPNAEYPRGLLR